ncbi:hypothetical protein AB4Z29_00455 [Paenibacillus sp. 2TAB23]|uniref:hypothetical protein n=1 Tax=Paenibacillus sp. 2TAB23 TaxID=3233004 RepID=UPI003F9EA8CE
MPVQITINGENATETLNELIALSSGFSNKHTASATIAAETIKQPRASRTNKPVEPESKQEPIKEDPGPSDDDIPSTYSVEDLRAKAAEVAKLGKQAKVKAILTQFDSASISAVPEDKRAEVYAALEAVANE